MRDEPFPVEWLGRLAIVGCPGHIDISNVSQFRDRLLSVINRGAAVLIIDMTATESCDHAAVEGVARACQRAGINGTQVRMVVCAPVIQRVLSIEGLDRLVPIYPSLEAAVAAGQGTSIGQVTAVGLAAARHAATADRSGQVPGGISAGGFAAPRNVTPAVLWQLIDALGDGLLLAGQDGRIALVNVRCAEMFGYQRGELIGLPVESLVPGDVRAVHQGYRTGYQQAPQPRYMAERARLVALRKDGATLPVEISLSPLPTASEVFVLAVIRDATEPRRQPDLADLARNAADLGTTDLLDRVVNRLFQVGLSLQAASDLPGGVARRRLADALDQLDDVIGEIRSYAFGDSAPLATGWPSS